MTIISFFMLSGVCLSDLNREIMRIKRPKTIPIPNIKVSWEITSGGVSNAATIEKTSKMIYALIGVNIPMSYFSQLFNEIGASRNSHLVAISVMKLSLLEGDKQEEIQVIFWVGVNSAISLSGFLLLQE